MTPAEKQAAALLNHAADEVARDFSLHAAQRSWWVAYLVRSIRHIAYPDRSLYPKTRKGTKRHPVRLR